MVGTSSAASRACRIPTASAGISRSRTASSAAPASSIWSAQTKMVSGSPAGTAATMPARSAVGAAVIQSPSLVHVGEAGRGAGGVVGL